MDIVAEAYQQVKAILDTRIPANVLPLWKGHHTVELAAAIGVGYTIGSGERRKGSGLPVWTHLHNAASIGKMFGLGPGEQAALWLHDIVEDSSWTLDDVLTHFTPYITKLVQGLTQPNFDAPRKVRIDAYHRQLEECCDVTQTCKLIESLTNVYVIVDDAPKFAPVFLKEKLDLYNRMTKAHPVVRDVFKIFLDEAFAKLEA
ncbi:hypothetical protein [Pseudomonas phage vB_PaeM_PS119XW]|uniref:Uncharacterized protein n=1 Tax=Pseudomonas phage vB_PaeM_PS119XW TaxID=2601632 RepID=A0A5C1K7D7_9CAUD|nr:phosphohydrolase [Pseudomonas phage vB_PaeM_PS119XW]QEM42027.1 hypothetical protein [Pseudomonas phage vB_PaeM_PS119XW]BEG72542.1 hypothetical protein RVBP21_1700 [Pseudomonas phage BRkr]